jgi:hypothetical protein
MRSFISIMIAALVLFALTGCGSEEVAAPTGFAPDQTVEAYQYVHGGYVGQAVVKTDAEGALDVTLDEAFMPHTLGLVDIEADEWNEDNTVTYVVRGNTMHVAKHISYAGTNYVGTTVGTALVYVEADENGEPAGGQDLELVILRNQDNMAAWYDNIADGQFQIYTEFGGSPSAVTTTSYGSLFKRDSSYWSNGLGWKGNIEEVEKAAELNGVGYSLDEIAKDGDTWKVADATTGATLSDFKDYFNLIQLAAGRLKME